MTPEERARKLIAYADTVDGDTHDLIHAVLNDHTEAVAEAVSESDKAWVKTLADKVADEREAQKRKWLNASAKDVVTAIKEEREACAKVAMDMSGLTTGAAVAAAIRARGGDDAA